MKLTAVLKNRCFAGWWSSMWQQLGRPWFGYLTIFVLQLKVIWGAWNWRDLSPGDTANYFASAYGWFQHFTVNILWSPLYTAFYGSVLLLTPDIYLATVLHRVLIVLSAGLLILALLRRLLPPGLAWLTTAWWAILPINFNTIFEVHLFALLPILAVWLVVQWRDSPWSRGLAFALLCLSAVLVRNELVVGVGLFALVCLVWEIRKVRHAAVPLRAGAYLGSYGVPLALAACVVLFFYSRSTCKLGLLRWGLSEKHTVNMGQVFAFGYQQRHPEWAHSPWDQYQGLMVAHFGKEQPTLREMIVANPRAVLEHFAWNLGLTPNGLQVLLFNASSGSTNPDYPPSNLQRDFPLYLSMACGAIWLVALYFLLKERRFWWDFWLRDRALTWLAMLAVAAVALAVIPTQRPRPSYLFSLGVLLMAVTAMGVFVIVRRLTWLHGLASVMPLAMLGLCLAIPPYFKAPQHGLSQRLHPLIQRLEPFRDLLASGDTHFLKGEFAWELSFYLGGGASKPYSYALLDEWNGDVPLDTFLELRGINLFYLDESLLRCLETHGAAAEVFLGTTANATWKPIGFEDVPGCRWKLFQRVDFGGWNALAGLGPLEGPYRQCNLPLVCWGKGEQTRLTFECKDTTPQRLLMSCRASTPGQSLTVTLDGKQIHHGPVSSGDAFTDICLPLGSSKGLHEIVLRYAVWKEPAVPTCGTVLYKRIQIRPMVSESLALSTGSGGR
jgi:hypothetical protein